MSSAATAAMPAVRIEQLGYTHPGCDEPALREISFDISAGSLVVLAGATGSGKSTLLRALAGLIPHHAAGTMTGRVLLAGDDTQWLSPQQLAGHVGMVLQSPDDQLCAATLGAEIAFGLENLQLPAGAIGERIEQALQMAGLAGRADEPGTLLSGGEKQRLLLSAIVAMQPRLLLLDEPLSQLDAEASADLIERIAVLNRLGMTVLVAEHRLDDLLPHANRLLLMRNGRLAANLPLNDDRDSWAVAAEALKQSGLPSPELLELSLACGSAVRLTPESWAPAAPLDAAETPLREKAVHTLPAAADGEPAGEHGPVICSVSGLSLRWPQARRPLWENITLRLYAGQCVAIVGPNGSGKSSLLRTLAGLQRPTSGTIELAADASGAKCSPCVAVAQNPDLSLLCSTVLEELSIGPRQQQVGKSVVDARVAEVLAQLELVGLERRPPQSLSQGQRLRTAIAAALTMHPPLLLLDEPTTGQDPRLIVRLMGALVEMARRSVATVGAEMSLLLATHDLRAVQRFADRVLVLADGRLLADCTVRQLLDDEPLLRAARLRRPPLAEVRHRLGLRGWTVEQLAAEMGS